MAFYPITMNQVKQIHKLRAEGYGIKTIAAALGISKNTVKSYLRKTQALALSGEQIMTTANPVLSDQLKSVSVQEKENYQSFLQRAEHYVAELANRRKTHVTRMILWEEDFQSGLIQMRYSRFCFHLRRYLKSKQPSMVMVHHPGEKMFVDFAGDKLYYIDRNTGKRIAAEVLLITLGYSNYTLAVAVGSQKKEDLVEGLCVLVFLAGGGNRSPCT